MLLHYLEKCKNVPNYVEKNKNLVILSLTHMKMLLDQEINYAVTMFAQNGPLLAHTTA